MTFIPDREYDQLLEEYITNRNLANKKDVRGFYWRDGILYVRLDEVFD